jgi:eukaryotic-like serine/threonine-protein kinase
MSPEQATAEKEITARSDVYSLASVLYEMLTGQPPHLGGSAQQIIMKIIAEPVAAVTSLRKSVPPNVAAALMQALEKLPADRFESAKVFADALVNPAFTSTTASGLRAAVPPSHRPTILMAVGAAAFGAGLVIGGLMMSGRGQPSRTPGTFIMASASVNGISYVQLVNRIAVARDGRRIAYISADSSGDRLFLRGVADPVARSVGEGFIFAPFFSPDGGSLGYCRLDGVWTAPIGSGAPTRVYGGIVCASVSWDDDDRIRIANHRSALISVSAAGGAPDSLVFAGDTAVLRGELIGNGRLLLSLAVRDSTPVIAVRERDGRIRELFEGLDARLAPTDVLLFTRREGNEHVLLAVPFNRSRGELSGEPRVLERGTAGVTNAGGTAAGDLVYLAGSTQSNRQIVVTDFEGNERSLTFGITSWTGVTVAEDGRTVIAESWNGWFRSLWSLDLRSGALSRLTRGAETFSGIPSPDGGEVFYIATHGIRLADATGSWLFRQSLRDDAPPRRLSYPGEVYPLFVGREGAWLYVTGNGGGGSDINRLRIDGRADSVERIVATPAAEGNARMSPDGRWLAYGSNASGTYQAVVAPMSSPTRAIPIGSGNGEPVGWARNGRVLFYYLGQSRELWSVEIGPAGPVAGSARRRYVRPDGIRSFSLMPGGEGVVAVRGGPIYQDIIVAQGALAGPTR